MKTSRIMLAAAGTALLFTVSNVSAEAAKDAKAAVTAPAKTAPVAAPAAAPAVDKWAAIPEIVATYGDKKITKEAFIKEIKAELAKYSVPEESLNPEMLKKLAEGFVQKTVSNAILLQLAEKAGIKPSAELFNTEFDKMLKSAPPEELEMMKKQFAAQNTTIEAYKEKLGKDKSALETAAITKWIQTDIVPKIKVTDAEIKEFFEKNPQYFQDTVTASHILIMPKKEKDKDGKEAEATPEAKAAAKKKAEEILAKLKAGANFEELAEKESECPSGKQAKGSLGAFKREDMAKPFSDAAFALEPGKMSDVVETQFGYHIIKVTAKKKVSLDNEKENIKQFLINQKAEKEVAGIIEKEKAKLKFKLNI